jgi:hypothetical protein
MRWTRHFALVALSGIASCSQAPQDIADHIGSSDGVAASSGSGGHTGENQQGGASGNGKGGADAWARDAAEEQAQFLAKWEQAGIGDYSMRVDRSCFCPYDPQDHVHVEIAGGQVVLAMGAAELSDDPEYAVPISEGDYSSWYTVPGLFALIESTRQDADRVTVSYDPEYGFPDHINVDYYLGAVDDELFLAVRDFTPAG